jgi:hypothetical protein
MHLGELGIPIRMLAALSSFAIGLTTVVQLSQQVRHHALANLEAERGQRDIDFRFLEIQEQP